MTALQTRNVLVSLVGICLAAVPVQLGAEARSKDNAMTESTSITMRGTAVAGGVICPLIELKSGETVALEGVALDAFPPGTSVILTGRVLQRSRCQQGSWAFKVLTTVIAE